jgi:glutathione S-transferase
VTPEAAATALAQVRASFDAVAERLADGPYLYGVSFTAADLTFAALAAAVLMPPQYAVPLPQPEELPAEMADVVRELRAHPAGRHALAMFRDERGRRASVEGLANG